MSKIVVIVKGVPGERRGEVLARLRAIIGRSLGEINRCLASGMPVMEVVLFRNDHEEHARHLRQLLAEIPALGASLQLFELSPDQSMSPQQGEQEISAEILNNILNAHEETKRLQQEMWDKHGHI